MDDNGLMRPPDGPGPGELMAAIRSIAALAIILIILVVGEFMRFPWQFSAILAALAAVGYVCMRFFPYASKTGQGWAFIYTLYIEGRLVRVLRLGGVYQSATYLGALSWAEPVFAYHRAFDAVFAADRELWTREGRGVRRVLALGGGGFAWPKHALMGRSDLRMDVVELDQRLIELAQGFFYVNRLQKICGKRLRIIEGDARAYLEERAEAVAKGERLLPAAAVEEDAAAVSIADDVAPATAPDVASASDTAPAPASDAARPRRTKRSRRARRYDVIVNDTFAGAEPVRALATVEAARAVHGCLEPGGVYAMNVVSRDDGRDLAFLRDEVATLAEVFQHVHVLPVDETVWAGEDNYIVLATDARMSFDGAIPFDEDFLGAPMHDEGPAES